MYSSNIYHKSQLNHKNKATWLSWGSHPVEKSGDETTRHADMLMQATPGETIPVGVLGSAVLVN